MGIAYDGTKPSVGGDPNIEYNTIRTNFASIQTFVDVDHVDFSESDYGKHNQMTMANKNTPIAQIDPQSVYFTASGVASTNAGARFINATGTFALDLVRAYVVLAAGAISNSQSFNVASIASGPVGSKDITFNGVTGTTFGVIGVNTQSAVVFNYSIIGAAQIRVSSNSLTSTIIIIQV